MTITRRRFLFDTAVASAALAVPGTLLGGACAEAQPRPRRAAPGRPRGPAPAICRLTEDNIEGPYYRPGAPWRANLADARTPGTRLLVTGAVRSTDCRTALAGAVVDVWHASADGHYDNDGSGALPVDQFVFRGRLHTGADGRFALHTIIPGRYLNGPQYRPSHVHVKVRAAGHAPLTTQLYFDGDPYNAVDPWVKRSLVLRLESAADRGKAAEFDFTLARTAA